MNNEFHFIPLTHSYVSPLAPEAQAATATYLHEVSKQGHLAFRKYPHTLRKFKAGISELIGTDINDLSIVGNSAEGLSLIAQGFSWKEGDTILLLENDYPSNVYPWKLQERHGVTVKVLPFPLFPISDPIPLIENALTAEVRMVSVSHVQFTNGYRLDIQRLAALCKKRQVDLVVDAAQSLGIVPLAPLPEGVSALVASCWKWLLGHSGTAILYTRKDFRERITISTAGPDMMKQGSDYLDHRFQPWEDGRKFEYSTLPYSLIEGNTAALTHHHLRFGMSHLYTETIRLQDIFLEEFYNKNRISGITPCVTEPSSRSGILSLAGIKDLDLSQLVTTLEEKGILLTTRGGLIRIAPHYYLSEVQMQRAAQVLAQLLSTAKRF